MILNLNSAHSILSRQGRQRIMDGIFEVSLEVPQQQELNSRLFWYSGEQ